MKTLLTILLVCLFIAPITQARFLVNANTSKYSIIEENRLIGLQSDNEGLQVSCAYYLGEMKSQKAVIPLMNLLRTSETCEGRIIAALSLIKIGDPQGVYMVSRVAKFSDCEKTRKFCSKFYNSFVYHQQIAKNGDLQDEVALN